MKKTSATKKIKQRIAVISLGGSIVYPHHSTCEQGVDVEFLKKLREFILAQTKKGLRFIIVVGGGKACRMYQKAARLILGDKKKDADLDWLGIQVTKLNSLFVAKILNEISFPQILEHEPGKKEINAFLKSNKKLLMVAGWAPGWSTDYVAVKCALAFGQKEVIVAGDSAYVCDKDPRKFADAKPIKELTWNEYQKLIPEKWTPGLSTPLDPPATQLSKKNNLVIKLIKGTDLDEFKKAVEGEPFDGSIIRGR